MNASTLSNKLFEDASEKDPEEGWRYSDCVNFDYNNYISNEPDYPKLKDMWQKVYEIKGKMRKLIIDYFFFLIKPNKLRKKKKYFLYKKLKLIIHLIIDWLLYTLFLKLIGQWFVPTPFFLRQTF